jgi:hypothetical protein
VLGSDCFTYESASARNVSETLGTGVVVGATVGVTVAAGSVFVAVGRGGRVSVGCIACVVCAAISTALTDGAQPVTSSTRTIKTKFIKTEKMPLLRCAMVSPALLTRLPIVSSYVLIRTIYFGARYKCSDEFFVGKEWLRR